MESTSNVEVACQGLEGAVHKYLDKYSHRQTERTDAEKIIRHRVQHACHILRVLTTKRTSLKHAVHALSQECWSECQKALNDSKLMNLSAVLTHVFYHYLRIRDGFILVANGECRHAGDVPKKKNPFPSRFSLLTERNDGYTKLYKSELGYSGASWDELFDEKVGVQRMLILALQKYSGKKGAWDVLVNSGAQLYESELDRHETLVKQCQSELEAWKNTWIRDLQSLFYKYATGGKVKLTVQEKMERLEVKLHASINGVSHLAVERRANDFQVMDKGGVLPNGWQLQEWKESMKLPEEARSVNAPSASATTKATHHRRGIRDDLSDDDVMIAKNRSAGLKVRAGTKKEEASTENETLNEIKSSFGVNAMDLETAREAFESEGAGHVVDPSNTTDQAPINNDLEEIAELREEIHGGRGSVARYRKIRSWLIAKDDDDCEIWDSNECLREAMMSLGSNILLLADLDSSNKTKLLMEARDLFRDAIDVVQELKVSLKTVMHPGTENFCNYHRNNLLLRGRALTNHGIALQELSTASSSSSNHSIKLMNEAIGEFKSALTCTKTIREQILKDKPSPLTAAEDMLKSHQLECLTGKWLGTALWKRGHWDDAVETFWSTSKLYLHTDGKEEFNNDRILLMVDCYYCCVSLVDLACDALEHLPMTRSDTVKRTETKRKGDELLAIVLAAYDDTRSILGAMKETCSDDDMFQATMQDHSIIGLAEIDVFSQELKSWWEAQKDDKALVSNRSGVPSLPRNDLFANGGQAGRNVASLQRFLVSGGPQQKSKKKRYEHAIDTARLQYAPGSGRVPASGSGRTATTPSSSGVSHPSTKKYLSWGDELLPQVKNADGIMVPLIAYPSIAPPLPPEMQGLIVCPAQPPNRH